ncbi:MAG: flagellar protein [Lachnospiraceae bacterium]|nr:flagellar protein [Lachnospiraceae bacterium]
MNVKNCRRCGKIFNYIGGQPICPSCREEIEKKFEVVKNYIRENPKASIPQICEECEVDTSQLQQWIREERLVFSDDSPVGIPCEKCGTMIHAGKYCDKCKAELANGLSASIAKPEAPKIEPKRDPRGNPAMRFLK